MTYGNEYGDFPDMRKVVGHLEDTCALVLVVWGTVALWNGDYGTFVRLVMVFFGCCLVAFGKHRHWLFGLVAVRAYFGRVVMTWQSLVWCSLSPGRRTR